jgi:hypothetical protein
MDELVKLVSKKTGLSEAMAQTAVNLVIDFIKKKLPAPVAAQVDLFLKNEEKVDAAVDLVGDLLGAAKKASAKKKAPAKAASAPSSKGTKPAAKAVRK